LIVEEGSSLARVAGQLEKVGAIPGSARTFRAMARIFGSGDPVQAGEFEIPAGMGGSEVLDLLQHGQPVQRLVTIPEGMPSILVWEKLMQQKLLTGTLAVPEEGSVLPNSYSFKRARAGRRAEADAGCDDEGAGRALGEEGPNSVVNSKREAIILASVVEKETGKASERPMVAGVYSNRIRQGIKLDADPDRHLPDHQGQAARPPNPPLRADGE
jgi:UPF0755 protein